MAKNSPKIEQAVPPSLTPSQGKPLIKTLMERGQAILAPGKVDKERFNTWKNLCDVQIAKIFGSGSPHCSEFQGAGVVLSFYPTDGYNPDAERYNELTAKLKTLSALLEVLDFEISTQATPEPDHRPNSHDSLPESREVFIVHGHDETTKIKVARMLEKLNLVPVILHERANEGLTIIEKFEKHAIGASFAVVLLTPDDEGKARQSSTTSPRARQNVLLELGYFIGRLGRPRVCVLYTSGIELPSDILGVVYTPLDSYWEFNLAKELKASGLSVDLNKLG